MSTPPPAIGIAPYSIRPDPGLAATSLSDIDFPLGRPDGETLGDLTPRDHVIFYPKSGWYTRPPRLPFKPSLVIAEPRAVHGWHMAALRLFYRRFHRILTRDERTARLPNALKFNFIDTTLDNARLPRPGKTRLCSIIASEKTDQRGHKLRHRIIERIREEGLPVDVMGRGYAPFGPKEEGLAPYRFSVIIENSREPGYITEKLMDCCLCRTIPIYWGAPDIGNWMDVSGMIVCTSEDEILRALRTLGECDAAEFETGVERNHARASDLSQGNRRAAEALLVDLTG